MSLDDGITDASIPQPYRVRVQRIFKLCDRNRLPEVDDLLAEAGTDERRLEALVLSLVNDYRLGDEPEPEDHVSRLRRFYERYDPSKLDSVERILDVYNGHEDKLFRRATEKYGQEPEPPTPKLSEREEVGEDNYDADHSATNVVIPATATAISEYAKCNPYRVRLIRMYKMYNREKIDIVDSVLEKTPSDGLDDLMARVIDLYGPEPDTEPLRPRLTRFYEHYNPEKLSNVESLLNMCQTYEETEALFIKLVSAYGAEPLPPTPRAKESFPMPKRPFPVVFRNKQQTTATTNAWEPPASPSVPMPVVNISLPEPSRDELESSIIFEIRLNGVDARAYRHAPAELQDLFHMAVKRNVVSNLEDETGIMDPADDIVIQSVSAPALTVRAEIKAESLSKLSSQDAESHDAESSSFYYSTHNNNIIHQQRLFAQILIPKVRSGDYNVESLRQSYATLFSSNSGYNLFVDGAIVFGSYSTPGYVIGDAPILERMNQSFSPPQPRIYSDERFSGFPFPSSSASPTRRNNTHHGGERPWERQSDSVFLSPSPIRPTTETAEMDTSAAAISRSLPNPTSLLKNMLKKSQSQERGNNNINNDTTKSKKQPKRSFVDQVWSRESETEKLPNASALPYARLESLPRGAEKTSANNFLASLFHHHKQQNTNTSSHSSSVATTALTITTTTTETSSTSLSGDRALGGGHQYHPKTAQSSSSLSFHPMDPATVAACEVQRAEALLNYIRRAPEVESTRTPKFWSDLTQPPTPESFLLQSTNKQKQPIKAECLGPAPLNLLSPRVSRMPVPGLPTGNEQSDDDEDSGRVIISPKLQAVPPYVSAAVKSTWCDPDVSTVTNGADANSFNPEKVVPRRMPIGLRPPASAMQEHEEDLSISNISIKRTPTTDHMKKPKVPVPIRQVQPKVPPPPPRMMMRPQRPEQTTEQPEPSSSSSRSSSRSSSPEVQPPPSLLVPRRGDIDMPPVPVPKKARQSPVAHASSSSPAMMTPFRKLSSSLKTTPTVGVAVA
eukprot:PhM_4_TR3008/c0_g1_i1/m.37842